MAYRHLESIGMIMADLALSSGFDDKGLELKESKKLLYCNDNLKQYIVPDDIKIDEKIFDQLMAQCPKNKITGEIFGNTFTFPRYIKTLGMDYRFSGRTHIAEKIDIKDKSPLDNLAGRLTKFVIDKTGDDRYNGVLVEWYKDGNDHLAPHRDSRIKIYPDTYTFSFWFGDNRFLRFAEGKSMMNREFVELKNNTFIVMPKEMQSSYYHQIPIADIEKKPQICISIRAFYM